MKREDYQYDPLEQPDMKPRKPRWKPGQFNPDIWRKHGGNVGRKLADRAEAKNGTT